MKKFLKRNREYLALGVYAIFIAGLIYFVIKPLIVQIYAGNNKIQEDSALENSKEKRLAELPNLEKQFNMVTQNEEKIKDILSKDQAVDLLQEIEKLAADTKNNVSIKISDNTADNTTNKSASQKKNKNTILENLPSSSYVKLDIKLTGDYNSILVFLRKIESIEYYGDVANIALSAEEVTREAANNFENAAQTVTPFSGSSGNGTENNSPQQKLAVIANLTAVFYIK